MAEKTKIKNNEENPETFNFQTEVQQLLELMVHSLYSHKEIFLRELISNASDALDRLRFEALTHPELISEEGGLRIQLEADPKERMLTIHDNGIGMNRQELIENIGTIAKSGTRELVEKLRKDETRESLGELIGQFGVGFYSSFMVAERVVLVTRRAGEPGALRWASKGGGKFEILPVERDVAGTSITLYLKSADEETGLDDFTDEQVITRTVKRYSDFIAYPIVLKSAGEDTTLNSMKPIWERASSEVSDEDYAEFYRHISHDWRDPLDKILQRAEGTIEYRALLFIPGEAPSDLYYVSYEPGLRLYVKRVQIMERSADLLPRYLRFIQGVVDSPDLPLNISREMLQDDRQIRQIRKGLLKKILDSLRSMRKSDEEKYLKFWSQFGKALKEGVTEDLENKDKLVELLLFASSNDAEKLVSLADYVSRMKEGQEAIYYLSGESRAAIDSSPHLEAFRARDIEVLYLTDPVDEFLVQVLADYKEKKLRSAAKGEVDLGSEEERQEKKRELDSKAKNFAAMMERIQKVLDDRVKEVRLSTRLTDSPACLVGGEEDVSPRLEKLLRQQGDVPPQRRILELNPSHDVVIALKARSDVNEDSESVPEYAELLYGYALLAEGADISDPAKLAARFAELMRRGLGIGGGG